MDNAKNNNIPYMVDVNTGDVYYVFTADDGVQSLNKFSVVSCINNSKLRRVLIGSDSIIIDEDVTLSKTPKNRKFIAKHQLVVC